MSDAVLIRREGAVLWIRFNRPEKRNALTSPMYEAICDGVREARDDSGVRVLAFGGEGDAFTAGNDLQDFATWGDFLQRGAQPPVLELIDLVADFDKPMIAGVRGAAVGIGTTLLLHCDVVLASGTAKFCMPFAGLGVVPEFGASWLLPRIAGRVLASHALLTAEPFDLDRAVQLGIVSEPCGDGELDQRATERAAKLAAMPPLALKATRRLLRSEAEQAELRKVIHAEKLAFIEGLASAEHREAVTAFFEKRPPRFDGC